MAEDYRPPPKQEERLATEDEIMDILKLRAEVASLKLENARLRKRIDQLTYGYEEDENPYSKFAKRFNDDEEQSEAERQDLREQIYRMREELNAQKEKSRIEMKKQLDKIMYEKEMRRLKDINLWLGGNGDFS